MTTIINGVFSVFEPFFGKEYLVCEIFKKDRFKLIKEKSIASGKSGSKKS